MTSPYYADEYVSLYLGDCRELADVWVGCDVLVTDPPYGIGWRGVSTTYRRGVCVRRSSPEIAGDRDTSVRDEVLALWGGRPAVVFGSWRRPRPAGVRHRLIWDKQGADSGPVRAPFMTMDEEIYVLGRGFLASSPPQRSVVTTREKRSQAARESGHPTPKPVGLMELLVSRCPEGVVADPFAGSGSTLVAARNLGRAAVGVELEEAYCELAARRLSQQALDLGGV